MSTSPNPEESIVDAALEMPAHERAAYLDKLCGDNQQLRQLVDALLHAHKKIISSQIVPPCEPSAVAPDSKALGMTTMGLSVTPIEKPGDHIGRYKLLQQIGEGGGGIVYMAEQVEPVRRRVALKILKLGMDTRQVIARFEAERQALALMDHPNIAKVHDAGATATGRPYFVMELVRGIKITDYCDQNNLSTEKRLDLFIQVCKAAQHAHQKGVIHRDIKPSNILVTLHDGAPVPKVIDFGIAKATTGQPLTDKTVFTAFEQFIGTPAYMSPEQAEMSGLDIDTRSDIYSLGVLLYELLTGQMPFDPGQLAASGFEEMRRIIRTEDPLRPSTRLSNLNAADQTTVAKCRQVDAPRLIQLVRGDLDWIVMKCLEKDRARRYDTANGLASDIQRYLSNEPIVARPPSNLYRFQKLVRRNQLAFAAAGAIAMMLVLGVLGSTWQAIRAMRAEREQSRLRESAQRAQANEAKLRLEAQTEAARSKQIAQLMKDMLQGVGPRVALGRNTDLLREILDQTARRLGKDLSAQPVVDAELRETLGVVYRDLGQYTDAEGMLLESLRLRKQLDGQESVAVASALHNLAEVFRLQVRDTEAEEGFREALRIRRKFLGNEHPDVAASLYGLAEVLRRGSGTALADAESAHREALAIRRKLPGRELETASSLTGLGVLLKNQPGKLDEAETCLRQAVEIQRPRLGEHPDLAYSLCNLGYVLRQVPGKQTEAEALLREALAMQKKILGNHRDTAMTLYFLAGTVTNRGEALILHREALDMRRKVLGEKHPDVTASLTALDNLLIQDGDVTSLRVNVERLKESGADPKKVAKALNSLALALRELGKFSESEASLRELLAMQTKLAESQLYASAVADLANVLRSQGRNAEAEPLLREAIILFEQLVLKNPKRSDPRVQLGHSQWQLAQLLNDTGQLEQAERVFRQALQVFEQAARDFPANLFLRQEQAFSHRSLAEVLIEAGRGDEAEHEFRASIALYAGLKAAAPSMEFYSESEGYTTWMLAIALERAGRLDAAEAEYRRAIAQHEQAGAAFPKETVLTERLGAIKARLVELLRRRGKLAEAKSMYREVAERGSAPELNLFGWSLATDPDSNLRDGTNAVVFAEKAVAATSRTNASYLDTLAAAYAEVGQFTNAVRVQQEGIALLQNETAKTDYASRLKLYENNSPYRDQSALAELARNRLREGKFAEAEGPARECLAIRDREIPDDWHTFNARAMLGGALLGQKKYAEAEPLLLAGYNGMKQREARIPAVGKTNLKEALQSLMQLYEATDRPEQAAEWKQKLEEFDHAEIRKQAPSSRQ